ncbi:MAG: hypothetical protein K6G76_12510, partial [Lachnospiraceae bacterium]|nr:hypothetical protein [Lachnospiraceae bacterium]
TGFKDSFDHAKTKFGPKSKKSDENVSSNSSVHQENQCSNHSVDTCGDGCLAGLERIHIKRLRTPMACMV